MICNAVHPQAEALAVAGVTIEPCHIELRPSVEAVMARFWSKVDTSADCWIWTGCRVAAGYGRFWVAGHTPPVMFAHVFSYEIHIGPIQDGMVIDHVCHSEDLSCPGGSNCSHRPCVNPSHLEQVTNKENLLRGRGFGAINQQKTHCPQGHEYTDVNTSVTKDNERQCRECHRLREQVRRRRGAAA